MANETARGDTSGAPLGSGPASLTEARNEDSRLRRAFLEESEELSQHLSDSLVALDADRANTALLNEVFRLTHSLKSESALMGFTDLSTVAHRMEDLLGRTRDGTLTLDRRAMDAAFAGCDRVTDMIGAIAGGGSDKEIASADVLERLREVLGTEGTVPGSSARRTAAATPARSRQPLSGLDPAARIQLAEARDRGETLYRLLVHVAEDEPMKLARAYLVFANLEQTCNVLSSEPSFDGDPAEDTQYGDAEFYVTSAHPETDLRAAAAVDQITGVELAPVDIDETLRSLSEADAAAKPAGAEPVEAAAAGPAPAAQTLGRRRPVRRRPRGRRPASRPGQRRRVERPVARRPPYASKRGSWTTCGA